MSKQLQARADIIQLIRNARIDLADLEMDFDNRIADDEALDMLIQCRDSLSTAMYELDQEYDHREEWLY